MAKNAAEAVVTVAVGGATVHCCWCRHRHYYYRCRPPTHPSAAAMKRRPQSGARRARKLPSRALVRQR